MERLAGVEPAISALATQRLTARLQPLIFWLREGDSNPTIRGSKDHCPAIRRSRNILPSSLLRHTPLIHVSYSTDIVTNWLASKASNLDFPRSERGVFPVTPLATNVGCAGGSRTRITLINSQVLCQLRYRAMLHQTPKAPNLVEGRGLESPAMELISLVRPENGNTLSRRLRPRGWYKSVIDSEHHNFCTLTRLSFKSQMQMLQLLVTYGSWGTTISNNCAQRGRGTLRTIIEVWSRRPELNWHSRLEGTLA
jgi:hypothetical protein